MLLPFIFSIIVEVLTSATKQETKAGIYIEKNKLKLTLLAENMILYTENPIESTRNIIRISELGQVEGIKSTVSENSVLLKCNFSINITIDSK